MEATAIELGDTERALFKDGEPADPHLQRRYRLYRRVEAALALPAGPERLAALHRAMIDGDREPSRPPRRQLDRARRRLLLNSIPISRTERPPAIRRVREEALKRVNAAHDLLRSSALCL
jgi:hypothetical protein